MSKKNQDNSESEDECCKHVFKQGKKKGMYCPVTKIFKDGYCKMHYEREFPQKALKPAKKPKIQEIDDNGEQVEYSDYEAVEPVPDGADIIEVKVKREVYLDIDFLLTAIKKQQAADAKPTKTPKTKKTKTKKVVKAPKKRRQAESVSEDVDSEEESMISESEASADGQIMSLNRNKSLYVDCLRNAANSMFPLVEFTIAKYTPLKVQGVSQEFAENDEVQAALEDVIVENFPESIEEATPTTRFLLAVAAMCVNMHARNSKAEAESLARQRVNPLLEEKYSEL